MGHIIGLPYQGGAMAKAKGVAGASGALFEEDFVLRTLGKIGHDYETALTELVANAWDAGAARVNVIIPSDVNGILTVEDDGHGMTPSQFRSRWMKLGYNRTKNQGNGVQFPPERATWRRKAFGRNGIGRHGLLCFADRYTVETWVDGILTTFVVSTKNEQSPFHIEHEASGRRPGHGTRLSVEINRHLPKSEAIRTVLSARFLHDPQFVVEVNGLSVPLSEHEGLIETKQLEIEPGLSVTANVVDTTKSARSTRYQGIAFWVNNRLVGEPSWAVGTTPVIDGRSRFAKRFAIVVQGGDAWASDVEPDWSRFKPTELSARLFAAVVAYAQEAVNTLSALFIEENSEDALMRNREEFRTLPIGSKVEVAQFTHDLVKDQPGIHPETLNKAVKALIKLQSARNGMRLLDRLLLLDDKDLDGLDRMLEQWSVQDALVVLDEIDARLSVIAAIEKLAHDATTDELHTLHPLVTQARWLFGPEFDSSEYASNSTLRTVAVRVFKAMKQDTTFRKPKNRPDLVILRDATLSVVGTETFDSSTDHLASVRHVLLIELKKGRSTIDRQEVFQAEGYIQDFMTDGALAGAPFFHAYVVGHAIAKGLAPSRDIKGNGGEIIARVTATTYSQLTDTANRRLHGLKESIPSRYEDVSGYDLVQKVMGQPSQATILPPEDNVTMSTEKH
jgi:hypothetical protein